jgi:uncharacterized membrane protein
VLAQSLLGPSPMPSAGPIEEMRAALAELTARVERLEAAERTPAPPVTVAAAPSPPVVAREAESRLGGYWAARLGMVSLVTGLALFVALGVDRMGPAARAAVGYALGLLLAGTGRRVMRRYQALGRILVAGGLGVGYFTTYAIHHVPAVRLVASPELAFMLLAGFVLGIIVVAQAMQSETVAGLALFLGLHTGMVSHVGLFTLSSGCLLAAGATWFMCRNRWVIVPLSTLVAVYSTLVTWLLGNPLTRATGIVHPPDHLATALGFVALYHATFAVAIALTPRRLPPAAGVAFALLNWTGAAVISAYELAHHGAAGLGAVFAILAVTSLGLAGLLAWRLGRALIVDVQLALAAMSIALAACASLGGAELTLALCVLGAGSTALARALDSRTLRGAAAAVVGIGLAAHLVLSASDTGVSIAVAANLVLFERLSTDRGRRIAAAGGLALVALVAAGRTVSPPLLTATWIGAAGAIFAIGLRLEAIHYRLVGLGVFALAFARLFLHDLRALSAGPRIASFLIAGALLLAVSFIYTRRRDREPPV